MPLLTINNIDVEFPKTPYECQEDYMRKVLSALSSNSNALLESPTGTGKTLCLLCSTLAWQNHTRKLSSNQLMPIQSKNKPASETFTIIYASRTHSQLAQVVQELKSTSYKPKVAVLGSRDQLCIHEKISKLPTSMLNHSCNNLNNRYACSYHNNLDKYGGKAEGAGNAASPILDIEDLVLLGKRENICPYFYSRESSEVADIIFLPYNYLIDTSIRNTLSINWDQSIIIFDEAHNIEKIASDASSFSLSSSDIAACINEFQQVLKDLQSKPSTEIATSANSSGGPSLVDTARVLRGLFGVERALDRIPLQQKCVGDTTSCVLPGEWLVRMLDSEGLHFSQAASNLDEIKRCADHLLQRAEDVFERSGTAGSSGGSLPSPEPKLIQLHQALKRVFRGSTIDESTFLAQDYKVFVCEDTNAPRAKQAEAFAVALTTGKTLRKRVLHYWAFSPGVAMDELCRLGVRSILLTSGTLSPLDSFKEDLRIPFSIELVNPHVIEREQIWVGGLSHGPTLKPLNSTFSMRGKNDYKDELGLTILSICQTAAGRPARGAEVVMTGPQLRGGVLVFFPSYSAMDDATDRWKVTGIWERLRECCHAIVTESKGPNKHTSTSTSSSKNFHNTHLDPKTSHNTKISFTENDSSKRVPIIDEINDTSSEPEKAQISALISEFDDSLKRFGSCMLIAVCRGKVSEGIDFSGSRGRIAIITGLPYAPYQDPWVILKKQFLDDRCARPPTAILNPQSANTSDCSSSISLPNVTKPLGPHSQPAPAKEMGSTKSVQRRLNGAGWYSQAAARAVNQAIGRVIRHKYDWGAIFLLDDRFLKPQQISQLSSWVRPSFKPFESSAAALKHFRHFVTTSLTNTALNPQAKSISLQMERRVPPSFRKEADAGEMFTREVVLSKDQLQYFDEELSQGVCFVPPELLSTQYSNDCIPPVKYLDALGEVDNLVQRIGMNSNGGKDSKVSSSSSSSSSSCQVGNVIIRNSAVEAPISKGKFMQQLSQGPSSISSVFVNPSSKRQVPQNSAERVKSISRTSLNQPKLQLGGKAQLGRLLKQDDANFHGKIGSSSIVKHSTNFISRDAIGLAGSVIIGSQSDAANWSAAKQSSAIPGFAIPTLSRHKGPPTVDELVNQICDKFTGSLDSCSVLAIKTAATKAKNYTSVAQAIEYGDALIIEAESALPNLFVEKALMELDVALTASLREEFRAHCLKVFLSLARKIERRSRSVKEEGIKDNCKTLHAEKLHDRHLNSQLHAQPQTTLAKKPRLHDSQDTMSSQGQHSIPDKMWQPSDRMKRLVDASVTTIKQTLEDSVQQSSSSAAADFIRKVGGKPLNKKSPNLQCSVCQERCDVPCAARCGHVCCAQCWKKILEKAKTKSVCPVCRGPASFESISKLRA